LIVVAGRSNGWDDCVVAYPVGSEAALLCRKGQIYNDADMVAAAQH